MLPLLRIAATGSIKNLAEIGAAQIQGKIVIPPRNRFIDDPELGVGAPPPVRISFAKSWCKSQPGQISHREGNAGKYIVALEEEAAGCAVFKLISAAQLIERSQQRSEQR